MEVLCADGDCPSPRPRSCMPVTEGECTGADATCNVCGEACYGEPPASGTRPDVVICRPRE
jgi:hypothetical protein